MLDVGPTAFHRSGTASPVPGSVTATSLSSRVPAGQQNDPPSERWVPGEHGPGLSHESEMDLGALKPDAAPFPVFSSWARNW